MLPLQTSEAPQEAPVSPIVPLQPMIHNLSLAQEVSEFLSARDVARYLGVATVSVYRLAERRILPVYRILRKLLFRKSDVLAWVETQRTAPRDPSIWP